jgi:hypothetical protein
MIIYIYIFSFRYKNNILYVENTDINKVKEILTMY